LLPLRLVLRLELGLALELLLDQRLALLAVLLPEQD
jgi:hypothetical protein